MSGSTPQVTRRDRVASRLLVPLLAVALIGSFAWRLRANADVRHRTTVPQNSAIEAALGVRFTLAAVVAGGGIVQLSYTVLDAAKAAAFQNDVLHPPVLRSEQDGGRLTRTALMKQGHTLRPGQTYYVLYLDGGSVVRPGGTIEIDVAGRRLAHVPVR